MLPRAQTTIAILVNEFNFQLSEKRVTQRSQMNCDLVKQLKIPAALKSGTSQKFVIFILSKLSKVHFQASSITETVCKLLVITGK